MKSFGKKQGKIIPYFLWVQDNLLLFSGANAPLFN